MIGYEELITVLPKLPADAYAGMLFRRVALAALKSMEPHQFLYSLGASRDGARFTPKSGPASLYVAQDESTAEAESKHDGFESFRKAATAPAVVFSLKVSLKAVLDLTNARIVKRIGSSQAELTAPWQLNSEECADPNPGISRI